MKREKKENGGHILKRGKRGKMLKNVSPVEIRDVIKITKSSKMLQLLLALNIAYNLYYDVIIKYNRHPMCLFYLVPFCRFFHFYQKSPSHDFFSKKPFSMKNPKKAFFLSKSYKSPLSVSPGYFLEQKLCCS